MENVLSDCRLYWIDALSIYEAAVSGDVSISNNVFENVMLNYNQVL